ncbi:MAG: DUF488 family protein [Nitrospirales bacterium]|nr:DUF488 family protein [Nitrospira sp.]MDR4502219.1 DUF488 family protein [Nitrospirales bacterium]
MPIVLKRVYKAPAKEDGLRVLVERLWPRGISKEKAQIDLWLKEAAPSKELRTWFGHDPDKWKAFKNRYFQELKHHSSILEDMRQKVKTQRVTFVFASKEERYNNAVALKEYLEHDR